MLNSLCRFATELKMPIELNTPDSLQYQFHPFRNGIFQFRVRAANDAHLILSGEPNETHPIIEVFIGGWQNSKSIIRYNHMKPEVAEAHTPGILNVNELRGFWIRYTDGVVTVGREGEAGSFLLWYNPTPFYVNYAGVCTGWGATGAWVIDDQGQQNYQASTDWNVVPDAFGGSPCWVPASNGQVPPNAVEGGTDAGGEALFVARYAIL